MSVASPNARLTKSTSKRSSQSAVTDLAANELIFAVVGAAGSGTSEIAQTLAALLPQHGYDPTVLKARLVIESRSVESGQNQLGDTRLAKSEALQDAGDALRETSGDNAAVAVGLVKEIRAKRAQSQGAELEPNKPVEPDGTKRAYILDSIRHPDEVGLLRRVYQQAFCLIGVFCQEDERFGRLSAGKYSDASANDIQRFMRRDENAPELHGQKVSDAFHLSDYFVDNTRPRFVKVGNNKTPNQDWDVSDQLGRLVDILTRDRLIRPRPNEIGMFHAHGARMQSSCLSRQVGAALLDERGAVVATGTNEVPRAGGGVYGGVLLRDGNADPEPEQDFRCFAYNKFCTNTRQQNLIIDELLGVIGEATGRSVPNDMKARIKNSRIGQLLEFSRAVHAEMDALLSAARNGIKTVGSRLFVTTFPCHSCARHIVTAGVEEVQYIEPYLKSQAIPLHGDAIVTDPKSWKPPSGPEPTKDFPNVLFRAFIGVAPRLYRRAFMKDGELKDASTGEMTRAATDDYASSRTLRVSYAEVEARLSSL